MGLFRPLTSAKYSSLCLGAVLGGSQSAPGKLTWVSAIVIYHCWEGNGLQVQGICNCLRKTLHMVCQRFSSILLIICEVLTISYWLLNHM